MSDLRIGASENYEDLELITRYLNGQLDPERVKAVRRRLEEDPEFLDFAAPLLLAWSVPPEWQRTPRPPGELERHWGEFTRRAGFIHQRRKARRRWIIGVIITAFVVGVGGWFASKPLRVWYELRRDFVSVPHTGEWTAVAAGTEFRLRPGSTLSLRKEPLPNGALQVRLNGAAHVRIYPPDTERDGIPNVQPLMVVTRGGEVAGVRGEFTVETRGDTTDVLSLPSDRSHVGFFLLPTMVGVESPSYPNGISLRENQRGRLIRGQPPMRIP